jgi:predicted dehydrogenase
VLAALAGTGLAVGGGLALRYKPWQKSVGANSDIRLGVVGMRNKGSDHLKDFREIKGARIAALCDVDSEILAREKAKSDDLNENVATYSDVRKFLENKDIDAVVVATPNHWHALIALWAMEAGKDVYVEKPVSHNIHEGRLLVESAKRTGRIVQAGTQYRSEKGFADAIAWLREGHLGKIEYIRSVSYTLREPVKRRKSPLPIPKSMDYELWCGPAEKEELYRSRVHYDWHWFWNTGNGDLGNMGIHDLDIARWFLGADHAAPRVTGVGGRFATDTFAETPNTQLTLYEYPDAPLIHEIRGLPMRRGGEAMDQYKGLRNGNVVHCEDGYIAQSIAYDNHGKKIRKFSDYGGSGHHLNFLKAVAARDASQLHAPILEGHLSTSLCHQGNIAYRLGQSAEPAAVAEHLKQSNAAGEALASIEKHLAVHGVDLTETPLTLGPTLNYDPATERFTGDFAEEANTHLTRPSYRPPYTLPNHV